MTRRYLTLAALCVFALFAGYGARALMLHAYAAPCACTPIKGGGHSCRGECLIGGHALAVTSAFCASDDACTCSQFCAPVERP